MVSAWTANPGSPRLERLLLTHGCRWARHLIPDLGADRRPLSQTEAAARSKASPFCNKPLPLDLCNAPLDGDRAAAQYVVRGQDRP
jgi:hypothetical protein